ncbi:DEAD/DEAH box helicase family protein [Paraburkholderia sp. RL17-381-BIF-C]|uniref:DEAD/DEAH box helicase family protein n=1 Tax=Paraburkholderia sp. RL17-381-BIF-C TaxID=3031635 RepID=UPI0038BBE2FA
METQFFHERRVALGNELIEQRAACRGLIGILSSRVELVPHQVDVARRVLEDPLQRYLLADEVGMGKTIEAGFIVRQYLLTESDGRVMVVVPPALLEQWRRELHDKFCIDQFANRLELRASDDPDLGATVAPGLLIVDEAHHLVSGDVPSWLVSWSSEAQRLPAVTRVGLPVQYPSNICHGRSGRSRKFPSDSGCLFFVMTAGAPRDRRISRSSAADKVMRSMLTPKTWKNLGESHRRVKLPSSVDRHLRGLRVQCSLF